MPRSLHSQKIEDEKDEFVNELYKMMVSKDDLISGKYSKSASIIHKYYLIIYIMNYFNKITFCSEYYRFLLTSLIESESLCLAGFTNASMMLLRSSLEMTFKFVYYETHPVEWELHETGAYDLKGIEYRNFLYMIPNFSRLNFENRNTVENIWGELCKYSHYDINVIKDISIISEIKPIFSVHNDEESFIKILKSVLRIIVICFFTIASDWMKDAEKSYFDYIFEILFKPDEVSKMKIELRIV